MSRLDKVRRQAVPRRGDPSYAELFEQAQRDYDLLFDLFHGLGPMMGEGFEPRMALLRKAWPELQKMEYRVRVGTRLPKPARIPRRVRLVRQPDGSMAEIPVKEGTDK